MGSEGSELTNILKLLNRLDAKVLAREIATIMSLDPFSVFETLSISEAVEIMIENKISSILVVDENNKLKGIFTERDALVKIATSKVVDIAKTQISSFMTANPHVERGSLSIAAALNIMVKRKFRHLPIVDEAGNVIGIVSVMDVMAFLAREIFNETP